MSKKLVAEYNGQTKSLYEWSSIMKVSYPALCRRYMKGCRGEQLFNNTINVKCKVCGKEFTTQSSLAKCCSKECKIENNRINSRKTTQRLKNQAKSQITNRTLSELDRLAIMAGRVNMSYGYYTGLNKL